MSSIENISKHYVPNYVILDLKQYIYILTYILQKLKTVVPDNHQSLQERYGTKLSPAILIKHFNKLHILQ